MILKLLTQSITLDDYVRLMIEDQDRYMEFVREQVALQMATYLIKEYALYECFPNEAIGTNIHQYTLLIEDEPGKIIDEIIKQEKAARDKDDAG